MQAPGWGLSSSNRGGRENTGSEDLVDSSRGRERREGDRTGEEGRGREGRREERREVQPSPNAGKRQSIDCRLGLKQILQGRLADSRSTKR